MKKDDRATLGGFPWIPAILLAFGVYVVLACVSLGDASELLAAVRLVGLLSLLMAVGGLLEVAVRTPAEWRGRAMRWGLLGVGGVVLIDPGWGTALALAAGVFALAWAGPDERRYL